MKKCGRRCFSYKGRKYVFQMNEYGNCLEIDVQPLASPLLSTGQSRISDLTFLGLHFLILYKMVIFANSVRNNGPHSLP